MNNIRQKIIDKIKADTGLQINNSWKFKRPTLNWAHKSAGRMIWYYYTDAGIIIGSAEKMRELLKSDKIKIDMKSHVGFIEISSS